MAKFIYPEDGLERITREKADNIIEKLQLVLNDAEMYIPPEFPYRDWLQNNLKNDTRSFMASFEHIREKIASLDNRMRNLEDDSTQRIENTEIISIKEKERLIK